jgi:WD40 repeat protein
VTVDPEGALDEDDRADNTLSSPDYRVRDGVGLRLVFVPVKPSNAAAATCDVVKLQTQRITEYLRDALPVPADEVVGTHSCAAAIVGRATPAGHDDVWGLIKDMEEMRAASDYDHVVGITPAGYLGTLDQDKPAVGYASAGSDALGDPWSAGLLVDPLGQDTGSTAVHELGHAWGQDHTTGLRGEGLRVSTMQVMSGGDLMSASAARNSWVSGPLWELLNQRFEAARTDGARAAADETALSVAVTRSPDGDLVAAPWAVLPARPTTPIGGDGDVTLRYLDDDGDTLGKTGLRWAHLEAVGSAAAEESDLGRSIHALVPWVDGTSRLVVEEAGKTVLTRDVSEHAPVVADVTATPGTVPVNGEISVSWSAEDSDGDAMSYGVDLSRDAGETWEPVAVSLRQRSLTVPVDASLAGRTLSFRVRATDGVLTGTADGGDVRVDSATRNGRIAFVLKRMDHNGGRLGTDIATTAPAAGGESVQLTDTGHATSPSWSPDGSRIAYADDGSLWTMAADGTDKRRLIASNWPENFGVSCVAWSPDGARIAFTTSDAIESIAPDGAGRADILRLHWQNGPFQFAGGCPAWSPDGARLAVVARNDDPPDDRFFLVDARTGATTRVPGVGARDRHVSWSPGGLLMALAHADDDTWSEVAAFTVDGRREYTVAQLWDGTNPGGWEDGVSSPDGTRLSGVIRTGGAARDTDLETRDVDGSNRQFATDVRATFGEDTAAMDPAWQPLPEGRGPDPEPVKGVAWLPAQHDGVEGERVLLDATGGARPGFEVPSYSWDLDDDGEFDDATGATASFVADDDGSYPVAVRVELANGTVEEARSAVVARNVAPAVTAGEAAAATGSPFSLADVTVQDASGDLLTAHVAWEGGPPADPVDVISGRPGEWTLGGRHAYASAGERTVDVEVCDDDGGCAQTQVRVSVQERLPELLGMSTTTGPAVGGTRILLTGRFLADTTQVLFGGTPGADLVVHTDRLVEVASPQLPPGLAVDVTARGPRGLSEPGPALRWNPRNGPATVVVQDAGHARRDARRPARDRQRSRGAHLRSRHDGRPVARGGDVSGGELRYEPADRWSGSDTFAVAADDGTDVGPSVAVTVVTGSRAPALGAETLDVAQRSGAISLSALLANDVDADGDAMTVVSVTDGTLAGDELRYAVPDGADRLELTYEVEDATGMRASATSWLRLVDPDPGPDPSPSPTASPAPSPSPSPTASPAPSPSPSPTASPAPSPSPSPGPTSSPSPSPVPTSVPSSTASPVPTAPSPSPGPTASPRPADDSCPAGRVPEDGFQDVPNDNIHEDAVDCIVWWRVAKGRNPTTYAPAAPVTRGQMASFIAAEIRASGAALPDGPDTFGDVAGSVHAAAINALAAAGIVHGRTDGTYRPDDAVTRGQMAKFLLGAFAARRGAVEPTSADYFADDGGTTHEQSINTAAAHGLTGGIGGNRYGPGTAVRRDQMASFLVRVLDVLVEEGRAVPPQ